MELAPTDLPSASPPAPFGPPSEVVETELGGLFYLLNFGIYLGLYGDFTTPREPGIALNAWDFAALLGAELLADPNPADPIWPLLAWLAARTPDEPPGEGFDPPLDWRIGEGWLKPFAETSDEPWPWSVARGRLRLQHPLGFLVLDIVRRGRSDRDQLRSELSRLRLSRVQLRRRWIRAPRRNQHRRPVDQWVSRLAAYSRARLARALALDSPGEVGEVLLRSAARVSVSPSHVDVTMYLADLPIEVRGAGLDRDPGWVPAAGRVVAFHFQ